MRKKGSLNKPKFISVSIKEINSKFHPDALVKIDAAYSILFETPLERVSGENMPSKIEEDEIEMKVT